MTESTPAEPRPHGWLRLTVQEPMRGWRVKKPQVLARPHAGSIGPHPQPNHAARYLLLIGAFIVVGLIVTMLR